MKGNQVNPVEKKLCVLRALAGLLNLKFPILNHCGNLYV